ncbi:MAG: ABC transporter ATP-binding protein/permease, partial [Rikenellaceae bacterium]|nr:ABC transporter ATP-binding protein/permease [Rikenellaceae bacterium]
MTFARASASFDRILEVLDTEPSLADTPEGASGENHIRRGVVEFRRVSFRYGDGDSDALSDISFQTTPGETLVVVGATGSAKTTLVQLISRLYDVTAGEVLIDGKNVKDYSLDELHCQVGMVLQKNVLFSGTILENLRWGDPQASQQEVIRAAKAAQAHDFIVSFPDGYDTVLGRGGVNVSGGQKHRL